MRENVTAKVNLHIRPDADQRLRFDRVEVTGCDVIRLIALPGEIDLGIIDLYFHHTADNNELVYLLDSLIDTAVKIRRQALVREMTAGRNADQARIALENQEVRVD